MKLQHIKNKSFWSAALCLFMSFSVQGLDPRQDALPCRIVSLGKELVREAHFPDFLEMAASSPQNGKLGQLLLTTFPELQDGGEFQELIATVHGEIETLCNPISRIASRIAEIHLPQEEGASAFGMLNPFDLTKEEYGYFKMGYGLFQAMAPLSLDNYALTKPGHASVLQGLQAIYEILTRTSWSIVGPDIPPLTETVEDLPFYQKHAMSLSRVYFAFALEAPEFHPWSVYDAAGAYGNILVASTEWNAVQKRHLFHETAKTIHTKIQKLVTLSPAEIQIIRSAEEGQDAYIKKICKLMDSCANAYLTAHKRGFFQSKEVSYQDTIANASHMLVQLEHLRAGLAQSFSQPLEESWLFSALKSSFLDDGRTPCFQGETIWQELVFTGDELQELLGAHPALV